MDPQRAAMERDMIPSVGARFFREGGEVMFRFVIDTANVIGPRPARPADQEAHPAAWRAFCAADGVGDLDRAAGGAAGASPPAESQPVAVEEVPGPGGIADGLLHSDPPTEKPKATRKYTRRKKG